MWSRVWRVALLCGVAGCASASYRPNRSAPQAISAGQVRVVQVIKRDPSEDEITLETELEPGTTLRRAGLSAQDDGCPDPLATLQTIDGEPRSQLDPAPLDGRHTLTLNVGPDPGRALALETERLGERICDRIELDWPHAWQREPFWLADMRLSFVSITPDFAAGGFRLLAARWMGRLRIGAELGLGNAVVCEDDDEACPARLALPVALEAGASWYFQGGLFLIVGARPLAIWAQREPEGALALRALALQATSELLLGGHLREQDVAPAGGIIGIGVSAGPGMVLDGSEQRLGVALGFQFNYGVMP